MPVILHLYSITVDLKSNSDSSAGFHDAFIITTFHAPVFFTVFISDQTLSFLRAPYFNLDTCCQLEGQSNQSPEGGEPLRRAHSCCRSEKTTDGAAGPPPQHERLAAGMAGDTEKIHNFQLKYSQRRNSQ